MIISRTPLRVSFVGGGSDIANFYHTSQGVVVSTSVNKYIYIAVGHQFDGRIILNYSKTELVSHVDDIENNLIREAMKLTGVSCGIHITSIADIPSEGSGMGSSSSYIVGLLNALYAYQGKHVSAELLAKQACQIEINTLGKPIGKQDQYIAAYGGFKIIKFNQDDTVFVEPVLCASKTIKTLEQNLLLLYTGITRSADPILSDQTNNLARKKEKRQLMQRMVEYANELYEDLSNNTIDSFGEYLHENWKLKRLMAGGVTNRTIDRWYRTARRNGAIGGKLLGAGGGGFFLFYAPKEKHDAISRSLSSCMRLPFAFEPQGSTIIFVSQ